MDYAHPDHQIAEVLIGILKVRRDLDADSFDALVGAIMVEIDLGMQLAEEAALERAMRRRETGNVVRFPECRRTDRGLPD